ncbi:hypothetical protein ABIE69_001031 [Rhodobacteraceae bacterium MBR-64]|jgi:hypothetical protein
MLGYVTTDRRGTADPLLCDVAARLRGLGWRLAGAVQVNLETDPERPCDMELHVLVGDQVVRISQNLGAHSGGCRLDPAGLEAAVGLVEAALDDRPRLMIVNKFGKQEVDGRGFRPVIGRALVMGVPVLTAVNPDNMPGFAAFAGGMGIALPASVAQVLGWCLGLEA